jgi:IclR family pca regulon transcriptional regulator
MNDILSPTHLDNPNTENSDMFVHAFARGLHVIRSFGQDAEKQTLSEVARRSEISRASARRLLHTLLQLGYVDHDGKHFWLKPKIMDLGYSYISSMALADVAQPAIDELAARTGSSASMMVLDGHDVVYIARSSIRNGSRCTHSIGNRLPANLLAVGRILLGELSEEELDSYLSTVQLSRYTPYTVTDPVALGEIIRADRENGWSIIRREMNEGICAVGMPIRDTGGRAIAALGLSIRPDLSTDDAAINDALGELRRTVDQIGELIRLRGHGR